MADCKNCQSNKDEIQIQKAKDNATEWARANNYKGWLIIVKTVNSYGFKQPGDESLQRLKEVDTMYFNP